MYYLKLISKRPENLAGTLDIVHDTVQIGGFIGNHDDNNDGIDGAISY